MGAGEKRFYSELQEDLGIPFDDLCFKESSGFVWETYPAQYGTTLKTFSGKDIHLEYGFSKKKRSHPYDLKISYGGIETSFDDDYDSFLYNLKRVLRNTGVYNIVNKKISFENQMEKMNDIIANNLYTGKILTKDRFINKVADSYLSVVNSCVEKIALFKCCREILINNRLELEEKDEMIRKIVDCSWVDNETKKFIYDCLNKEMKHISSTPAWNLYNQSKSFCEEFEKEKKKYEKMFEGLKSLGKINKVSKFEKLYNSVKHSEPKEITRDYCCGGYDGYYCTDKTFEVGDYEKIEEHINDDTGEKEVKFLNKNGDIQQIIVYGSDGKKKMACIVIEKGDYRDKNCYRACNEGHWTEGLKVKNGKEYIYDDNENLSLINIIEGGKVIKHKRKKKKKNFISDTITNTSLFSGDTSSKNSKYDIYRYKGVTEDSDSLGIFSEKSSIIAKEKKRKRRYKKTKCDGSDIDTDISFYDIAF